MLTDLAHLLCAVAISFSGAAADDGVVSYRFPAFNAATTTTGNLLATTNSTVSSFDPGHDHGAMSDRTEGFLLLARPVDIWRAGAGEQRALEASFNTSFALGRAKPISFVVLLDGIPLGRRLRGEGNYTTFASSEGTGGGGGGMAAVQVGPVMSYGPYYDPDVGLNVTVTPRGPATDAGAQCLSVYVAAASEPRPSKALLDVLLRLAGRRTTETAYIGFFAAMVRDVIIGVRDWNLTLHRFPPVNGEGAGNGNKQITSWMVVLLAVLGSVVCCF